MLQKTTIIAGMWICSYAIAIHADNLQQIKQYINSIQTNKTGKHINQTQLDWPKWQKLQTNNQHTDNTKSAGNSTKKQGNPLSDKIFHLHNVKSKEVLAIINSKSFGLLGSNGKAMAINNGQDIYVHANRNSQQKIQQLITQLDHPIQQVMIQARIVDIDQNYLKQLGIVFTSQSSSTKDEHNLNFDLPDNNVMLDSVSIPIVKLQDNSLISMQINALQQEGHAKLISRPELMTINRKPAVIESGEEIPYQQATTSGATSVAFKKAVLKLDVTPVLMPNHDVLLHIKVNQDKVGALTVLGEPTIHTQQMSTNVLVHNTQTVVLGGIFQTSVSTQHQRVPILSNIPIVGKLFRRKLYERRRKELLIFITPKVIGALNQPRADRPNDTRT